MTVATTSKPQRVHQAAELGEVGAVIDVGDAGELHRDEHGGEGVRWRGLHEVRGS